MRIIDTVYEAQMLARQEEHQVAAALAELLKTSIVSFFKSSFRKLTGANRA